MEWRWIPESEQLASEMPGRQLTIAWDEADEGWYLSVIVLPRPSTLGQPATQSRVYVAPLPLLAALIMVQTELHPLLVEKVQDQLHMNRGEVLGMLGTAVEQMPQLWPGPARARKALTDAAALMDFAVERLSLDMAAVGAMED